MDTDNKATRIEFIFLNGLRDSGITNMFGAGPHVQAAFGVDRHEAKRIVLAWMEWVKKGEAA
jgi:hypothetical protein